MAVRHVALQMSSIQYCFDFKYHSDKPNISVTVLLLILPASALLVVDDIVVDIGIVHGACWFHSFECEIGIGDIEEAPDGANLAQQDKPKGEHHIEGSRCGARAEYLLAVEEVLENGVHLVERAHGDAHVEHLVAVEEMIEAARQHALGEVRDEEDGAEQEPDDLLRV